MKIGCPLDVLKAEIEKRERELTHFKSILEYFKGII